MMNLVLLPADGEDWSDMQLGDKRPFEFPSGSYKFMVNDVDGIGRCMTHSLYSPMREFASHPQAVQIARDFLQDLMVEPDPDAEAPVDEELLGRVMRGEATPEIDLDQFDEVSPMPGQVESGLTLDNQVSRRDLLRGKLGG
jgi:[NiFe] hydrogenase assembly HybE family chaperone